MRWPRQSVAVPGLTRLAGPLSGYQRLFENCLKPVHEAFV
jgi:hypothetical protein